MTRIGCHLSDRNGFMGMAYESSGLGANTFQFFTRNPRGGRARTWDEADLQKFAAYQAEHDMGPIVAYAPYTADPASGELPKEDFAKLVFSEDLARMEQLPGQLYAAHPGSAIDEDRDVAIAHTCAALNEVLTKGQTTTFLIVNLPGAGNEIGGLWGAGYDVVGDLDGVLAELDRKVGLERVKAVHLADPRYDLGTHHTHHLPLGEGKIGLPGLCEIAKRLRDKVLIFETPHDDVGAYGEAIKALAAALE